MSENTDLVQYEEQLRRELAGLRDQVTAPSSNRITTKGKVFKLPNGQTSPGPLIAIVLDFIAVNQYWAGVYNENQRSPADCQAVNRILKDLRPDPALSPKLQHATCDGCPHDKWGTGPRNVGKACKNQRKLLIVAPDFTAKTEPMTIMVSPTGIKHWDKYVRDLAADGVMPVQMVTEISFDPSKSYPTLLFKLNEERNGQPVSPKHGQLANAMYLRQKYQEMLVAVESQAEAA